MREGRSLELLVEYLERLIADKSVTIESPKFIKDKKTGEPREYDVVITYPGHHDLVVAIDCKDWGKKVDTTVVESFWTKCVDTGISSGMLVSPAGFTAPAMVKAKAYTISCLTLSQALAFDWIECPGVTMNRRVPKHIQFIPLFDDEALTKLAGTQTTAILDDKGSPLDPGRLWPQLNAQISQLVDRDAELEGVPTRVNLNVNFVPHIAAVVEGTEAPIPLHRAMLWVFYVLERTLVPFKFFEYGNADSGEVISRTAYADLEVEKGKTVRISMVQKPGEDTGIFLTPRGEKELPEYTPKAIKKRSKSKALAKRPSTKPAVKK